MFTAEGSGQRRKTKCRSLGLISATLLSLIQELKQEITTLNFKLHRNERSAADADDDAAFDLFFLMQFAEICLQPPECRNQSARLTLKCDLGPNNPAEKKLKPQILKKG